MNTVYLHLLKTAKSRKIVAITSRIQGLIDGALARSERMCRRGISLILNSQATLIDPFKLKHDQR